MNTKFIQNGKVLECLYCGKVMLKTKEVWWAGNIFQCPQVAFMASKGLLICDCEKAKRELKLQKKIAYHEDQVAICKEEIKELDDDLPF